MRINSTIFCYQLAALLCFSVHCSAQNKKANSLKPVKSTKAVTSAMKAGAVKGEKDFIEPKEDGNINWTDQYIEAEGNSVIDTTRFKNPAQAKLMAQRGAIADAQRNLLEIVSGVMVEGTTTVENLMVKSDQLKTSVKGLLKGARQVGRTQYAEGIATVRFRIPLYKKGLGEVVADDMHKEDTGVSPISDTAKGDLVLAVTGNYKPRLFPNLTDEQGNVIGNLAESLDPNGKVTKVVQQSKKGYEAIKKGNVTDIIDVVQDASGNLVVYDKSKATLDKWAKWGKTIWTVVKAILI